jgi:AraC-like DNA-binding protein
MDDPSFTIEQLSREMGMSHAQLHRKMTALTGQSALKFVRALRLAKARQLLLQTDLNISEIAYQTGFNDPAYFSRVFSNEVGCAPSVFRERH